MTNRKLRKILKENEIVPENEVTGNKIRRSFISVKAIRRAGQIAACLVVAAAICFGWVQMVRMVGRPTGDDTNGTSNNSEVNTDASVNTNDPGFHIDVQTDEKGVEHITVSDDGGEFDALNFGGKAISFFYVTGTKFDECTDGILNGDFSRDMAVEREEYANGSMGCKINQIGFASGIDLAENVKNATLSGTDSGIVNADSATVSKLAFGGYLTAMNNTKYLDFTKNYWPKALAHDLSVNGKVYMATGNISNNTSASINMVFYNINKAEKLEFEDLYTVVENGEWTLDKLLTLAASAQNGDDGIILSSEKINSLAIACGIKLVDNSGALQLSSALTDGSAESFCEKLAGAISKNNVRINDTILSKSTNTLFIVGTWMDFIDSCYDSEESFEMFGILPLPKAQLTDEYTTPLGSNAVFYAITSNADTDQASAIIQYYAYAFNKGVSTLFSYKYCNDYGSYRMIPIMNDSITFDLGTTLADLGKVIPSAVSDGFGTVAANIDSYKATVEGIAASMK